MFLIFVVLYYTSKVGVVANEGATTRYINYFFVLKRFCSNLWIRMRPSFLLNWLLILFCRFFSKRIFRDDRVTLCWIGGWGGGWSLMQEVNIHGRENVCFNLLKCLTLLQWHLFSTRVIFIKTPAFLIFCLKWKVISFPIVNIDHTF